MLDKSLMRERGQGLVEYALILVLVALVVIAILLLLGPSVGNVFSNVVAFFDSAVGGGGGGQQIVFDPAPQITKSPAGLNCTYTATNVRVRVTQGGSPVSGVAVGGTVRIWDNDGNQITNFGISGTTGGSGYAVLTGSVGAPCGGQQAVVSISGGPSATDGL
jgi:pilus assembly protein Flp/PilA